jgi:hypothetical protein
MGNAAVAMYGLPVHKYCIVVCLACLLFGQMIKAAIVYDYTPLNTTRDAMEEHLFKTPA